MSIAMARSVPMTTEDYETAFYKAIADAEDLNEHLRRDRVEIDSLKAESRAIGGETRAILASIGARVRLGTALLHNSASIPPGAVAP